MRTALPGQATRISGSRRAGWPWPSLNTPG